MVIIEDWLDKEVYLVFKYFGSDTKLTARFVVEYIDIFSIESTWLNLSESLKLSNVNDSLIRLMRKGKIKTSKAKSVGRLQDDDEYTSSNKRIDYYKLA